MESTSTLIHSHSTFRTRDELRLIATPAPTKTWRPVPHIELVETIESELTRRDITITRERFATTGPGDARLFGVLDLRVSGHGRPDRGLALGLRGANDKSMRLMAVAASRVFVCDNMCFSGDEGSVCLSRKHTSGLDLAEILPRTLDQFLVRSLEFDGVIDRMAEYELADDRAKLLIYQAVLEAKVMAPRYLPEVHRLYFDDEIQRDKFQDRTLWSLNNAFTEAVKSLSPAPQERAGLDIGRFFGQLVAPESAPSSRVMVRPGLREDLPYEPLRVEPFHPEFDADGFGY